jgi:hypothetical protein
MFPGVIIEPRGGHNRQDFKKMPETSSSSSSFLPPSSSSSSRKEHFQLFQFQRVQ